MLLGWKGISLMTTFTAAGYRIYSYIYNMYIQSTPDVGNCFKLRNNQKNYKRVKELLVDQSDNAVGEKFNMIYQKK